MKGQLYYTLLLLSVGTVIKANSQQTGIEVNHRFTAGAGVLMVDDKRLELAGEDVTTAGFHYAFVNRSRRMQKMIGADLSTGAGNEGKRGLRSTRLLLQYSHAFSLVDRTRRRWNNYAGYAFTINPHYLRSGDAYSWATVGVLSFYNSFQYSWKKSKASADITIPVIGFSSRPKDDKIYKSTVSGLLYNSFSALDLTSLHNLRSVTLNLNYQQRLTDRLSFTVRGGYIYQRLTNTNRFKEQVYSLQAGLIYHR